MPGGVYTGGGATVVMDPPPVAYVKMFHPGSGPDRNLKRRAETVAIIARSIAPYRTGVLKSNIKTTQNRDELGRFAFGYKVYVDVPYGYYVHEGTGPSPRWPDTRRVMKFMGEEGVPIYRNFVMHPGTPAQPFLQRALAGMVG